MKINIPLIVLLAISFAACKTSKPTVTIPVASEVSQEIYRSSVKKEFNLVHTRLDVRFDWSKRHLIGKAYITVKPHFYDSDHILLNARGMKLNTVALQSGSSTKPLAYTYKDDSLKIQLDRSYNRSEELTLFIDYISKPDELTKVGGSAAIISDKGLYFINHDGSNPYKPKQIWTQGETQASSVWFPTIDAPNQKMTQEIAITVDTNYVTLSNGVLEKSMMNNDGTRTDFWSQKLPHAPYLVMMAIGEFAVVKEKWRNMEVSYYVEPHYEKAARKIFGNTPEMLEFYSNKLKVDYPWGKYSQVVVRDYVSGAMENTSATLHGEFMQLTERELHDFTGEEYISHELFHHWFGDLVTCESWSNIPLNESFATYGEYIWNEYKYGREEADYHLQAELSDYLRESKTKQVELIRFSYQKQEEMFDNHSYEKGGCILHLLRKYIGDDAFYESLSLYLNRHKFKTVEIHDLRLAFEEVTGEDLNWFFDQWFFSAGHPNIEISYRWDEVKTQMNVLLKQNKSNAKAPVYKLPLEVDIYEGDQVRRQRIIFDQPEQQFAFSCSIRPQLVNVDAEKTLVGTKSDLHTPDEWIYMFNNAKVYSDKAESITAIAADYSYPSPSAEVMLKAFDDSHWNIRYYAIQKMEPLIRALKPEMKEKLTKLFLNDASSVVRTAAIQTLVKHYGDEVPDSLLIEAVNDSSYSVAGIGLSAIADRDSLLGLSLAKSMEGERYDKTRNSLLVAIYSFYGGDEQAKFVMEAISRSSGYGRYEGMLFYANFLKRCRNEANLSDGIYLIKKIAMEDLTWYIRVAAINTLTDVKNHIKKSYPDNAALIKLADDSLAEIKSREKDAKVLKAIGD